MDNLTQQLPTEVRDRKMQNQLQVARQELIDWQVALNLSRNQVEQLQQEIAKLQTSVAGREQLLAQAYPVFERAIDRQDWPGLKPARARLRHAPKNCTR